MLRIHKVLRLAKKGIVKIFGLMTEESWNRAKPTLPRSASNISLGCFQLYRITAPGTSGWLVVPGEDQDRWGWTGEEGMCL